MSNVYKFCSCGMCKAGRRAHHEETRKTMRKLRRKTKEALKQGKEPPVKISISYTD